MNSQRHRRRWEPAPVAAAFDTRPIVAAGWEIPALTFRGWLDLDRARSFLLSGVRVPHLESKCCGILEVGEVVGGEPVAQCIWWPHLDFGALSGLQFKLPHVFWADGSFSTGTAQQPRLEVGLDFDEAAARGLRFCGRDFYEVGSKIDILPGQSMQFRCPQAGERTQRQEAQNLDRCRRE